MLNFGFKQRLVLPGYASGELLFLSYNGVADNIGISANALWDSLPAEYRTLFLTDRDTRLADATIWANLLASPLLNASSLLVGSADRGIAMYSTAPTEGPERSLWRYLMRYSFEVMTDNGEVMTDNGTTMYEVVNA